MIGFFGECMLEQPALAGQAEQSEQAVQSEQAAQSEQPALTEQEARAEGFRFGGDTLNTALYLTRCFKLLQPVLATQPYPVQYFTAVGQDRQSHQLLEAWRVEGMDTSAVTQLADKTVGSYRILLDAKGERSFQYQRSDSAVRFYFRSPGSSCSPDQQQDLQPPANQQPDHQSHLTLLEQALRQRQLAWFYLSGISLAILTEADRQRLFEAIVAFVEQGGKLAYDNNFRLQLWSAADAERWQQQLLPYCQLALLTDTDEWALAKRTAQQSVEEALAAGCPLVVVKQGALPCLVGWRSTEPAQSETSKSEASQSELAQPEPAQSESEQALPTSVQAVHCWQVPAKAVARVVDSSAAGDAFAAGVLAVLLPLQSALNEALITAAMQCGHQLAAAVLAQHGAIIDQAAMPSANDLLPAAALQLLERTALELLQNSALQRPENPALLTPSKHPSIHSNVHSTMHSTLHSTMQSTMEFSDV